MTVDVLAIGAHPDDVDLIAGGTIAKLTGRGHSVAVVDLTRGEAGTRGSPEARLEEARCAGRILGLADRVCLDMGDVRLENTFANRTRVAEVIREFRPLVVLTHHWVDLHPDHAAAGAMVRDVMYTAGMVNFPASGRAWRPNEVLFFMGHFPFEPSFIVDVSESFPKKLEAVRCFHSQLHNPEEEGPETNISQPDFLEKIEARARHYGSQILKTHGEPFFVRRPVPVDDPVELYRPFTKLWGNS